MNIVINNYDNIQKNIIINFINNNLYIKNTDIYIELLSELINEYINKNLCFNQLLINSMKCCDKNNITTLLLNCGFINNNNDNNDELITFENYYNDYTLLYNLIEKNKFTSYKHKNLIAFFVKLFIIYKFGNDYSNDILYNFVVNIDNKISSDEKCNLLEVLLNDNYNLEQNSFSNKLINSIHFNNICFIIEISKICGVVDIIKQIKDNSYEFNLLNEQKYSAIITNFLIFSINHTKIIY